METEKQTPIAKHWDEILEYSCREGAVVSKSVKTRLNKPAETEDLKKGEFMDLSLIAGKPV